MFPGTVGKDAEMLDIDHIVVLGETLEAAASHAEAALGAALVAGGAHELFGTHNRLHGLAPGLYLEAIAVDPEAPAPPRERWFGLSHFSGPARLGAWVCRVSDIEAAVGVLPEAGRIHDVSRGDLSWRIAFPDSGLTPFDGLFPVLIQWQVPTPPGALLADGGIGLDRLDIAHPRAEELAARLSPHFASDRVAFRPAGKAEMIAHLTTPHGPRALR